MTNTSSNDTQNVFDGYNLALEMVDMKDHSPIPEFRGDFYFLSNFYDPAPCRIPTIFPDDPKDDLIYPTSEHAYQAAKTPDLTQRRYIQMAATAGISKRMGQDLRISIPWWNERKIKVMTSIVRYKFSIPHLRLALMKTGNRFLIEGNNWGDVFWGQVNGEGSNHLGHILMDYRDELWRDYELGLL